MTIKQVKTGWQVNIQPGGRGAKRIKKTFATKREADAWERHTRVSVQQDADWQPVKKDLRKLSDLCDLWFKLHGYGLNAGADTHRRLLAMCTAMGDPLASAFSANMFAEYRMKRVESGVSANNMNREHSYLRAVFNELIRLEQWKKENPLKKLRAFKIQERELSYLTIEQIETLLKSLSEGSNPHTALVAKICLSTGARWGEAEGLKISQIKHGMIQFVQTKSSKSRSIPITTELETEINLHHIKYGNGDQIFQTAFSAFRDGVKRSEIKLPTGQLTHVLRHSFASHFMMNGGNIIALQKALGHYNLSMTMRYAHLSPDHLAEAKALNPITQINLR